MSEGEGEESITGTLILADETMQSLTWHHSVEFDGYTHTTACGREIDCDDVRDVMSNDPKEDWHRNVPPVDGCGAACYDTATGKIDVEEVRGGQA